MVSIDSLCKQHFSAKMIITDKTYSLFYEIFLMKAPRYI